MILIKKLNQQTSFEYWSLLIVNFVFLIFVFCPTLTLAGYGGSAVVEKIIDGDTIRVKYNSKSIKVRLWGIDTPEYRQPYSKGAKKFTAKMVAGEVVFLEIKDWDDYGRMVAVVTLSDKRCLNEELVKKGFAWVHIYYCKEAICNDWYKYEKKARQQKRGLWQEESPVPPWVWKRKKRLSK